MLIEKALQLPEKADELAAEPGGQLDADADMDVENGPGFKQFLDHLLFDMVVIDHGDFTDALDPGVHQQVGGRFPPLGVGIVDMVVKGILVPLLWHLEQVVLAQFRPHPPRLAGKDHAEIVGQLQLPQLIALAADQLLHDLHQHPGGILVVETGGGAEHLVAEAA